MRTRRPLLAIALALLAPVASAAAQPPDVAPPYWPGLSLSFLQPTGTGGPNTPFDIWIRATLAPTADPILLDASAPDFGLPAAYLPVYGNYFAGGRALFASYFQATLSSGYLCNNDTFGVCGGGPYTFAVNVDGSGQPAWHGQSTFTLLPGQTYDYLFGTLTPQSGGGAAPGTYAFTGAFADVLFYGRDANDVLLYQVVTLAETCASGDPSTPPGCGFSRTVVADAVVPEPATVVLLGTGLLVVMGVRRGRVGRA